MQILTCTFLLTKDMMKECYDLCFGKKRLRKVLIEPDQFSSV